MNYFSYKIYLLLACIIAAAGCGGWLLAKEEWAFGFICFIGAVIAGMILTILVGKLKSVISTFLSALEAGDTTVSFKIEGDPALENASEAMSRIVGIYRSAISDLQTKKLYYDRILRVMTHEIRNDISPIISLSGEMAENPSNFSSDEMADSFEVIYSQSIELKHFLDSYYELTHIPVPEIRSVNVHSFLSDLNTKHRVSELARKLPPDTLRFISPVGMTAEFDPGLISRALGNLIRNALEAVTGKENPQVTVTASTSDDKLFFAIADNGTGFSKEAGANLFQPFFSTKHRGSGIGLYLARQIAMLHKGDLSITSQPGKGTTATIILG